MTSLIRLLAVVATVLLPALPAEPASFAYARSGLTLSVIDAANPSIVARIPTSLSGGGSLAVDSSGTHVYQVIFGENTVAVVDTASRTVISSIPVSRPSSVLMHPSGRVAYVSGAAIVGGVEAGLLAVIDTATNTVTATIPMGPGFSVRSMVLDPAGTKLYVSNSIQGPGGKVVVIDTSTNAVATTIPIVGPGALAAHPAGTFVYIINANGVSVLDTATDTVVATIPAAQLPQGPQKMIVNPNGTFLYVIAGINSTFLFGTPSGNVAIVDTQTNQVVTTIPLSVAPVDAALSPSGTRLYVIGNHFQICGPPPCLPPLAAGTAVIDTTTNTVMTIVPPGPFAISASTVTVDPTGHSVYANAGGLAVIDVSTDAVTATLPQGDVVFGATLPAFPDAQVFYTMRSRDGGQRETQWGAPGDRPAAADYDGDGRADVAIFRPRESGQEGVWWIQRSSDGGIVRKQWGAVTYGDQPVPADYDGDGKADLAVWRLEDPSIARGVWFILRSSDGRMVAQQWGARDDLPVPADYDGDGRADFAVWRPSIGTWFVLGSRDGAGIARQFGVVTDVPVPADYDGDGRADFAVWRPSTGEWFVMSSRTGAVTSVVFGAPGDVPVPCDYDGDGKADVAIWRPSTGEWFILRSSDGRVMAQQWGSSGDLPMPADFDGDRAADLTVYRP